MYSIIQASGIRQASIVNQSSSSRISMEIGSLAWIAAKISFSRPLKSDLRT
jgi:hypothetical protein